MIRYCERCKTDVEVLEPFATFSTRLCYPHYVARLREQMNHSNSRARCAGSPASLTMQQWTKIVEDHNGFCHYCKTFYGGDSVYIEHVIPIRYGGHSAVYNVVPACPPCNIRKIRELPR